MSEVEVELLARMRASKMAANALAQLGLTHADLERAGHDPPPGKAQRVDDYRRELGAELTVDREPGIAAGTAYAGSLRYRFRTSLWPGFDLLIREHPAGFAWGPEFVRAHGAAIPAPTGIMDLEPWTILDSEVRERFGPHLEEIAWEHGTEALRPEGLTLIFDYGLLQELRF